MKLVNLIMMRMLAPFVLLLCFALRYGHNRQFASARSVAAIPFELVKNHI